MIRPLLAIALAALLGCSSSTPKPADSPDTPPEPRGDAPAGTEAGPDATPPEEAPKPGTVVKGGGDPAAVVPDDYSLTESDCEGLGKQYGSVAKADQMAALGPKLTADKRAQAESNIDGVVVKLGDGWADHCRKALAGGVVDRKSLKCAFAAKTVKAFDVCLNGDQPAPAAGDKPGKGGAKPKK